MFSCHSSLVSYLPCVTWRGIRDKVKFNHYILRQCSIALLCEYKFPSVNMSSITIIPWRESALTTTNSVNHERDCCTSVADTALGARILIDKYLQSIWIYLIGFSCTSYLEHVPSQIHLPFPFRTLHHLQLIISEMSITCVHSLRITKDEFNASANEIFFNIHNLNIWHLK